MARLPSGTVTFLFTDLEASTRLWEAHPEAMKSALARHDEILRDAIESHGGHIVKMTGDGVHAAFATAHDALVASAAVQRALAREVWDATGPLRVRMGVHTGEAEYRDGDYYGPAVNRAARLMAAGHGGQVVVSLVSQQLAPGVPEARLGLVDLGEHRLRDLARPERIFQLTGPGLESAFPPLRSLDTVPGNMPPQVTSFVGRDGELAALGGALCETRVVTITGVGGAGKTRLAVQVAARVAPAYPDGVWLCELAPASDGAAAVEIVAASLGVTPRLGMSLEASILDFLRAKQLLVVVDNCEHLLDATARLVAAIVGECPGVRILATSREALAVAGEQAWRLGSLGVPDVEAEFASIAASDAVRLFVDRARAARPGFVLDASNAAAVLDVCRRLDGIPLAIELAAARVVAMNPAEIAGHLDERFRLLTGGRRAAVERHRTLRAAVDWSYSSLSETDRRVFDRLGVLPGGFDAAAATAIVTGDGVEAWDVIDATASLVAKSMLATNETLEGPTRYQLLETLRQYARDRLDEQSETDTWRRRHAQHYADFAEKAGRALLGPDELVWLPKVGAELDNLRAAVIWALDSTLETDREFGVRIVAGFAYEANASRGVPVGSWAERTIGAAEACVAPLRAAVLAAAAWEAFRRGDLDRARALGLAALRDPLPAESDAPVMTYVLLAFHEAVLGGFDAALAVVAEARAALDASATQDPRGWSVLAAMAAGVLVLAGNLEAARPEADDALRLARISGHPSAIANAVFVVAMTRWGNEPDLAAALIDESIALVRAGANAVVFPAALAYRARFQARRGNRADALAALREAIWFCHEHGDHPMLVVVLDYGIQVLADLGHTEQAAVVAGAATAGPLAPLDTLPRHELPNREQALDQARTALGDAAFDAAVARGAAMSPDEIVAYTLAEIDRYTPELMSRLHRPSG